MELKILINDYWKFSNKIWMNLNLKNTYLYRYTMQIRYISFINFRREKINESYTPIFDLLVRFSIDKNIFENEYWKSYIFFYDTQWRTFF